MSLSQALQSQSGVNNGAYLGDLLRSLRVSLSDIEEAWTTIYFILLQFLLYKNMNNTTNFDTF